MVLVENMENYILKDKVLAKLFIFAICAIICLYSCTAYSSNLHSEVSHINNIESPFYEDDICVKLLNNGSLTNVHSSSPTIYINDDNTYITDTKDNKLYRYGNNGEKIFIANNARKCFYIRGVLYFELWEGSSFSERKLACYANNKTTVLVNDCTFAYGKSGIYYKINGESKLYRLSYNTNEITFVTTIQKNYYFNAEYKGLLWFYGPDGMYCSNLDGSEMKLMIPGCYSVLGYRSNNIFFIKNNSLQKFSLLTNEIDDLAIPLRNVRAFNFTDNLCLIADENGLFAFDSDFSTKRELLYDEHIYSICISNNVIIVASTVDYENDIYRRINEEGEIIYTLD